MAKFGIALGSGPRGLGFESRYSDHIKTPNIYYGCRVFFLYLSIKLFQKVFEFIVLLECWQLYFPLAFLTTNQLYTLVHPVGAFLLHLIRYMGISIQCKCRCCITYVFLDCFYFITRLNSSNRIGVSQTMSPCIGYSRFCNYLFMAVINRL